MAAQRNSKPISEALLQELDGTTPNLQLLEISSGCGQHAFYFAPMFPNITFHTTEFERNDFPTIRARIAECRTKNIMDPLYVDVSKKPAEWQEAKFLPASFDYMYNSNMMHITPWHCSVGLFRAAGVLLKPGGTLFTYGPYALNGVLIPESNVNFDLSLKSRNSEWGVRDIADLKKLAANNNIELMKMVDMPSNNKFLSWRKAT